MKIAVCIKQVPMASDVKTDPVTKQLIREGIESVMNPFDYYALESAIRIREENGAEVIALSMGPPKAEAVLREAVAMGADRAVLLSDRRFSGSDTWATSYILKQALLKIGGVDLVICGKQALDGDTAQIAPGIAAQLNCVQATGVGEISLSGSGLVVKRLKDRGYDRLRLSLPAVLAVNKGVNVPRVPSLKGYLKAAEAQLTVWNADDIGADYSLIGLNGSPTRVVSTEMVQLRRRDTKIFTGTAGDAGRYLMSVLSLKGVL